MIRGSSLSEPYARSTRPAVPIQKGTHYPIEVADQRASGGKCVVLMSAGKKAAQIVREK